MFKVIVERPRIGVYAEKRGRRKEKIRTAIRTSVRDYFNAPKDLEYEDVFFCCDECTGVVPQLGWMEPMAPGDVEEPSNHEKIRPVGRGVDRRQLNENLKPLWRYLQAQVGRCWDDVYSEIRENSSTRSTMHMHVVQHVKWQVKENTYLGDDGRVYEYTKYNSARMPNRCLEDPSYYGYQFYVHPVTRELCVSPTKARKEKKKAPTEFRISPLVHYRMIDDEWWVVEFEKIPRTEATKGRYPYAGKEYMGRFMPEYLDYRNVGDILNPDGLENYKREASYGFVNIRAVSKRPLGKREAKKLAALLAK
jgi:hypothetical protein